MKILKNKNFFRFFKKNISNWNLYKIKTKGFYANILLLSIAINLLKIYKYVKKIEQIKIHKKQIKKLYSDTVECYFEPINYPWK